MLALDKRKLLEQALMADIEVLIHAFMCAEIEQFHRVSQNLPRDVQYVTLRTALASDVIDKVRIHDHKHPRK